MTFVEKLKRILKNGSGIPQSLNFYIGKRSLNIFDPFALHRAAARRSGLRSLLQQNIIADWAVCTNMDSLICLTFLCSIMRCVQVGGDFPKISLEIKDTKGVIEHQKLV